MALSPEGRKLKPTTPPVPARWVREKNRYYRSDSVGDRLRYNQIVTAFTKGAKFFDGDTEISVDRALELSGRAFGDNRYDAFGYIA